MVNASALMLCIASGVFAQQPPKDFFKHDFAASAGGAPEEGYKITPVPLKGRSASSTPQAIESSESEIRDSSEELSESGETIITPSPELELEMEPIPVHSIGAILSSMDKEHFLECMKELTDVAIDTDRMIAKIYTLGDMRNLEAAKGYIYKIVARSGELLVRDKVPKRYSKVTMSPTWILKTAKGEILLEATGPLAANFNSKGEFVDKNRRNQLVESNLTPIATAVAEGRH